MTTPLSFPVKLATSGTYMLTYVSDDFSMALYQSSHINKDRVFSLVHPAIWPFYLTILIPQLILTLVIYMAMYLMFYPLQAFFAVVFYGPAGFVSMVYCSTTIRIGVNIPCHLFIDARNPKGCI